MLPILYLEKLIQPIFGILGAAALTVSLFTTQVPASAGGFAVLNSPLITALALLLLLGVGFLSPICQTKRSMWIVRSAELLKGGNRFFTFNLASMQERSRALDARIYRQDRLLWHYSTIGNVFCTKGFPCRVCPRPDGPLGRRRGRLSRPFSPASFTRSSA